MSAPLNKIEDSIDVNSLPAETRAGICSIITTAWIDISGAGIK
jgi:hypothetical protein